MTEKSGPPDRLQQSRVDNLSEIEPADQWCLNLVKNARRPNIHNILKHHEEISETESIDVPHFASNSINHNMTPILSGFSLFNVSSVPSTKFSRHFPNSNTHIQSGHNSRSQTGGKSRTPNMSCGFVSALSRPSASVQRQSVSQVVTPTVKYLQRSAQSETKKQSSVPESFHSLKAESNYRESPLHTLSRPSASVQRQSVSQVVTPTVKYLQRSAQSETKKQSSIPESFHSLKAESNYRESPLHALSRPSASVQRQSVSQVVTPTVKYLQRSAQSETKKQSSIPESFHSLKAESNYRESPLHALSNKQSKADTERKSHYTGSAGQRSFQSYHSTRSNSLNEFSVKSSNLSGVLRHLESHPQLRFRESEQSLRTVKSTEDRESEQSLRTVKSTEDKEIQVNMDQVLGSSIKEDSVVISRPSTSQSAKVMTWAYLTGNKPEKNNLHFVAEGEEAREFDNLFEDLVSKRKGFGDKNVRARLNKVKLLIHDFKIWYRRRKLKQADIPIFRKEIRQIEGCFGSGLVSFFVFCRWILLLNLVMSLLWTSFVIVPTAIKFDYNFTQTFYFTTIFDGKNALEESWMFYCSYSPHVFPTYNFSLAYLAVILVTYFGSFLFVLRSLAYALGQEGKSQNVIRHPFCHVLFSSWDFSRTSDKAADHLHNGIINLIKDSVHDIRAREQIQRLTPREKCNIYSRRALAWIITGLLIGGGSGAIVYLVLFVDIASLLGVAADSNNILVVYGLTLSFLVINSTVPPIVEELPKFEKYVTGKLERDVTLARIFLLHLANLFALVISLYRKVNKADSGCAGTLIGQEIYKLVLLKTLASIVTTLIPPLIMRYGFKKKIEFEIPRVVLNIVYRQALIWFGMITCPVLPLVGALSTTIFFITNYIVVMKCCKPPTKRWNQPGHSSAFFGLLIATLVPVLVPVSVMIGSEDLITLGAENQGPFMDKKPLDALSSSFVSLPDWCEEAFKWMSSPVVLLPAILMMMAFIYFQRLRLKQGKKRHAVLHEQLQLEQDENKQLTKKLRI